MSRYKRIDISSLRQHVRVCDRDASLLLLAHPGLKAVKPVQKRIPTAQAEYLHAIPFLEIYCRPTDKVGHELVNHDRVAVRRIQRDVLDVLEHAIQALARFLSVRER